MGLDVQSQCYAEGKPHCSECKPYLHDDLVQDWATDSENALSVHASYNRK